MSIKCKIWWDLATQSYVVSSSYNEKLVEALKNVIPSSDRSFDSKTKFWFLTEPWGDVLRKIAESCFGIGSVNFTSKETTINKFNSTYAQRQAASPASQQSLHDINFAIVQFFALLSYDAAKAAYRKASHDLHPDKGGDPSKMASLNDLWSRIEKEVYRR